jgi:hypothetical protein
MAILVKDLNPIVFIMCAEVADDKATVNFGRHNKLHITSITMSA